MQKSNTNCQGSNILGLNTNTPSNNIQIQYKLSMIEHPQTQYQHTFTIYIYSSIHNKQSNTQSIPSIQKTPNTYNIAFQRYKTYLL